MLNKGKRPKVVLERGCSSFLEKERETVRERKRRGVNSLHFSRFGVIKNKKQEEGRRKEKIKVWKNQTINPFFFL